MSDRMQGQVVLITGGASGLGLAVAMRMQAEGARVAIMDRSRAAIDTALEQLGNSAVGHLGDVTDPRDCADAVTRTVRELGGLDCVISNAGIWDYNRSLSEFAPCDMPVAFRELFDVNVLGAMNIARAALSPLVKSRGSVIVTLSNAAFYPGGGGVIYTAAKHALVGVIKQLAYELAPWVRVNGVSPGAIATTLKGPVSMGLDKAEFPAAAFADLASEILPIATLPTPDDYAGSYAFLASRTDNVPLTGTVIHADGGFSAAGISQPRAGDDLPRRLSEQGE